MLNTHPRPLNSIHFNTMLQENCLKFGNYNIQFLKATTPAVGFRSMAEETGRLWRSSLVRRLITNMRGPRRTSYKELRWAAWQPWRWLWRRGKLGRGRRYINGMMVWMPYSVILKATRTNGNQKMNTKTPFTRAKTIGTARQILGTVLTILRHGTPNFRRVNVSVPNVMWHQCSKF